MFGQYQSHKSHSHGNQSLTYREGDDSIEVLPMMLCDANVAEVKL